MTAQNDLIENNSQQMRKGTLEFCVLLIIARGRVYSSDILKELLDADLLVVEGTLYPLLSRLKAGGLLEYEWSESQSGPPRKYYSLTNKGRQTLQSMTKSWDLFNKSINLLIRAYEKNN